jgi:hypothetical protein
MTSFDDAATLLGKWLEESTPLDFVLADAGWLTVMGRCTVTARDGFMVTVSNDSTRISLGLARATFRYEDQRNTIRFARKDIDLSQAVCALRVQFDAGAIAMFIEGRH